MAVAKFWWGKSTYVFVIVWWSYHPQKVVFFWKDFLEPMKSTQWRVIGSRPPGRLIWKLYIVGLLHQWLKIFFLKVVINCFSTLSVGGNGEGWESKEVSLRLSCTCSATLGKLVHFSGMWLSSSYLEGRKLPFSALKILRKCDKGWTFYQFVLL